VNENKTVRNIRPEDVNNITEGYYSIEILVLDQCDIPLPSIDNTPNTDEPVSEPNAVQRHREREKKAVSGLENDLNEIDADLNRIEPNILILKGTVKHLNDICGAKTMEVIDHQYKIENQKELVKILEKRRKINGLKAPKNDKERQKHQREKKKRLLELQKEEVSVKKLRRTYLLQDETNLNQLVNSKKFEIMEVYQMNK